MEHYWNINHLNISYWEKQSGILRIAIRFRYRYNFYESTVCTGQAENIRKEEERL